MQNISLKETHYAHNQVCNFLLGFYWNKFNCSNAQKHWPALQHCILSPSEMLYFSPCLFQAPPEYSISSHMPEPTLGKITEQLC